MCRNNKMSQCSLGEALRLFGEVRSGKDVKFKLQQRNVTSISDFQQFGRKQETIFPKKLFRDQPMWRHFVSKDNNNNNKKAVNDRMMTE